MSDPVAGWPYWSRPPADLNVPHTCPNCGAGPVFWVVHQPLGETYGMHDPNHKPFGKPGAPKQGSGVQMRCRRCGREAVYRQPFPEVKR